MASTYSSFRFFSSAEVLLDLKVFVSSIELAQLERTLALAGVVGNVDPEDLIVRAHVCTSGIEHAELGQATGLPVLVGRTVQWAEWLTLPFKIRDLSRDACVVFTVWAPGERLAGSCRLHLFDDRLRLRRGLQRLVLWPHVANRDTLAAHDGMTAADAMAEYATGVLDPTQDEMLRLIKAKEQYDAGEIPHIPWLDRLTMPQLARDHADWVRQMDGDEVARDAAATASTPAPPLVAPGVRSIRPSRCSHLVVEMPMLEFPVIYDPTLYVEYASPPVLTDELIIPTALEENPTAAYWMSRLVTVLDPEAGLEHPAEAKHAKLARSDARRTVDPSLKPNRLELRMLQHAIASQAPRPTSEQASLLWRYRFYLRSDRKALVKFLECVDWTDPAEAADAASLLPHWSPIDLEDALRLLGPRHADAGVRRFAVAAIARASDAEIEAFLLQLIQAVRYEPSIVARAEEIRTAGAARNSASAGASSVPAVAAPPSAMDATTVAASASAATATDETSSSASADTPTLPSSTAASASDAPTADDSFVIVSEADAPPRSGAGTATRGPAGAATLLAPTGHPPAPPDSAVESLSPLADFLIDRASRSEALASYLNWYVTVETEDHDFGEVYNTLYSLFVANLMRSKGSFQIGIIAV